jgi:AraC family transcriptional regulator, transcriptional activator of the genes for pyochelin and ferripyochelin receptors
LQQKIEKILANGKMTGTIWDCDGIIIGHGTSLFHSKSISTHSSKDDSVRLHFGVKGDYQFTHKQLNKTFDLLGGHHNLMYSQAFEMTLQNKTLEIETFGITFPKTVFLKFTEHSNDYLKAFCEKVMEGKPVILSEKWGTIDAQMQKLLFDIKTHTYTNELQKMFLLSKSMELLVLSAEACIKTLKQTETIINSKSDKEKIIAARDYINNRITNPPNLSEVSKNIGLNEYKLKQGFKEMFNTTLFNYLTEQRLHLAHQLLCDTSKTVADISVELGYATAQHFNNAFKKKFGVTPLGVKNNPKNAISKLYK